MSDCPEPPKQKLECMLILGGLKQGQADARKWMEGLTKKMEDLVESVAFMRGKLSEQRKGHAKLITALSILATAIAGAITAVWKLG